MPAIRYIGREKVIEGLREGTVSSIVDNIILYHGGWHNIDGFMMVRLGDKYSFVIIKDDTKYYYIYEEVKDEYVSKGV